MRNSAENHMSLSDERIGIISKELGSTEADLETFKRDVLLTVVTQIA